MRLRTCEGRVIRSMIFLRYCIYRADGFEGEERGWALHHAQVVAGVGSEFSCKYSSSHAPPRHENTFDERPRNELLLFHLATAQ